MPDANGKFKGIAVPRLPWKEPEPCDSCGLNLPRGELVPVTYGDGDTESLGYLCDSCAAEAGL